MEYSKIDSADTFNLFEVGPFETSSKDKPRKANERECKVYAQWLALKAGLLIASSKPPKLEWKQTGRTRNDKICIGAYFEDEFIAFPGADQNGAVELEILGDDGEPVSSTMLYKKATGTRSLTFLKDDIAAIRKAAKQSRPVPVISEPVESESEPPVIAEAAPVNVDAVESASEPVETIEALKPATFTLSGSIGVTMSRGGAWDWSGGYQGNGDSISANQPPIEVIRQDARRLRIIRGYLALRKQRAALKAQVRKQDKQLIELNNELIQAHIDRHEQRRHRARNAEIGRRLTYWARLERDTFKERAMKSARALESIKTKQADPTNPERASDLIQLRDERDQARGKLESVTNERDRLKAAIVANAETLDKMIDRAFAAEAKLRGAKEPRGYKMAAPAISFRLAA